MGFDRLVTGFAHVGIRVRDLEISRTFYRRLGFRFVAGPVGPEPAAILEHPSGTTINFILNADSRKAENVLMDIPAKHPGYTHMALSVTDVEAVAKALAEEGIAITEGPVEFPGARAVFIRDPDRNVIEFNQSVPATA
jgi:lactoylglutathione lyase